MFSVTHSFIKKARYQAPTRAARMPQETDVQRSMRVLDVLNFDTLRSMINKPELLLEYKRFLALKVGAGDLDATLLSPPAEVDEVWHAHILDTKHYRTTCELLGHGFIDHNPKGGEDTAARDTRRTACLAAYKKAFGAAVPDIWASVRPALAPRPQLQPTPRTQPQSRKRPRPKEVPQPARAVAVGAYVFVQVATRGRNERLVTRQKAGWLMRKGRNDEWVLICFETCRGEGPFCHHGRVKIFEGEEKIIKAPEQKAAPAIAHQASDMGGAGHIYIFVVTQDGAKIKYSWHENKPLDKLMKDFCERHGVASNSVRFLFDGNRINGTQTPSELRMWPYDEIDVMVEQQGC